MDNRIYLEETQMVNYKSDEIQRLINDRGWRNLTDEEKIMQVYNFLKDEILFGYNHDVDTMKASEVLKEGLGHCNTKATLFMALLRALGIPCRIHGFTIDKKLQKGAIGALAYNFTPREIIHTWTEVYYDNRWINMEGLIVDSKFLNSVQRMFSNCEGGFCGYAIATKNIKNPEVQWKGGDTYIQKEGIVQDFGIFNSPDHFYSEYGVNLKGIKKFIYKKLLYKLMNKNVMRIRNQYNYSI